MKSYINQLSLLLAIVSFFACEKVENKISFEGGTKPVLTASSTSVRLEPGEESNVAIRFNWTNPEYRFTTGISAQDVKYTLELDTLGGNFKSGKKYAPEFAKDLSITYTVGELNGILGNTMLLQLTPRRTYTLQARIISSLGINTDAVPLTSNVVTFTVSPFIPPPKVDPPASGKLYITGGATPGDWMSGGAAELLSQKFTKLSETEFEIKVKLNGGGSYLFVPIYGDWNDKYGIQTKNDPALVNGGDFSRGSNDIMAPAKTTNYKINVNFQTGKFTVVEQ